MGKQLSSFEQKILRDGMNSKSSQAAKLKEQLFNQATELQGALKVLEELDHVHTDTPSDTEPT